MTYVICPNCGEDTYDENDGCFNCGLDDPDFEEVTDQFHADDEPDFPQPDDPIIDLFEDYAP